jgi:hypothetical protein
LQPPSRPAGGWRADGLEIRERHGFAFVNLRKVSEMPCGEPEFDWGNDG